MSKSTTATKTVTVLARYQFKSSGHVVYNVRSSNGVDTYCTTIINGKATGCTCPSHKPCYHMTGCEQVEAARALSAHCASEQDSALVESRQPVATSSEPRRLDAALNGSRAFHLMR